MYRIAVDIGGTFTDCVILAEEDGCVTLAKSPSTPRDPSQGVIDAVTQGAIELGGSLPSLLERPRTLSMGAPSGRMR